MNFKGIFRGTLLTMILTALSLFIGAVLVYFDILTEKTTSIIVFAVAIIGIFISSIGITKTSENRLLLNALSVALLFSLILFIASLEVNGGFAMHTRTYALMGGTFASAFLGVLFGK